MSTARDTFVVDLPGESPPRTKGRATARKKPARRTGRGHAGARACALKVRGERIRSGKQLKEAFLNARGSRRPAIFVSSTAQQLAPLADVVHEEAGNLRLFVWEEIAAERREFLQTLFRTVIAPGAELTLLPPDELAAVLSSDRRDELLVGGTVNAAEGVIVLLRGSCDRLSVPFAWFHRSSDVERDFDDFAVTDYGQTVRLGDFEAATDAILYAFDASYRSRAKKRQVELDDSLGGSVRRLRELKNLKRTDFAPLSAKSIARIERGEVTQPRRGTMETIARRTGVAVEEIHTF